MEFEVSFSQKWVYILGQNRRESENLGVQLRTISRFFVHTEREFHWLHMNSGYREIQSLDLLLAPLSYCEMKSVDQLWVWTLHLFVLITHFRVTKSHSVIQVIMMIAETCSTFSKK